MDNMENLIARSPKEKSVYKYILPIVEKDEFELVRIKTLEKSEQTLQIMIDHKDRPLTVEDCATISRKISYELDKINLLEDEYHLEISSPGLDRPLTRLKDFNHWTGHRAIIKQKDPDLGISKLEVVLVGVVNSDLQVSLKDKIHHIMICNIEEAQLVA